ncbi:MAG: hypothetical protein HKM95_06145 [Inquilinus sp.]|nr:hypothetical protein [Inquilinus sp.]
MFVIRGIGYVLLLLAVLALVYAGVLWQDGVPIFELAGGKYWFDTDSESLNLVQAVTQRYLHPKLWDPGIVTVLLWPIAAGLGLVAAVFGIPGLLLVTLFRRRRRRLMR